MAGLGVVAGAALVLGVPSIRHKMFGVAGDVVGPPADTPVEPVADPDEVGHAHEAITTLDTSAMARVEAELQSAIDDGTAAPAAVASMQLAQVELLTARAVELGILQSFGGETAKNAESEGGRFAERATRIFEAIEVAKVQDRSRLKTARALLRLAQGRGAEEIVALLPEDGGSGHRLLVDASSGLRDPEAKIPDETMTKLRGLEKPSGLLLLALTAAYERNGDRKAAAGAVEALLAATPEQPTAKAIKAILSGETPPSPTEVAPPVETKQSPSPTKGPQPAGKPKPSSSGGGGGSSTESLIERGCSKVDGGDASGGVKLLLQAFDRKPGDLDVLVCLGQGYSKLGNHQSASAFYKRALDRAPRHRSALKGAAKTAARLGQTGKGIKLYQRLLQVDPSNSEARAYIKTHGGTPQDDSGPG